MPSVPENEGRQAVSPAVLHPVVVVTGVSGSGKTTVGTLLARTLGWPYAEADDFHSPANIAKMAAGTPLTDADRWPWLDAIAAWIDARSAAGESGVVTSSALKRSYRDRLRTGRPQVRMVFLDGSPELIARRMATRQGHFMKGRMLGSQFHDLEPAGPDEHVLDVPVDGTPAGIVAEIVSGLGLSRT